MVITTKTLDISNPRVKQDAITIASRNQENQAQWNNNENKGQRAI